jgi:hypothetical protein
MMVSRWSPRAALERPKCLPNEGAKCRQTISITYNMITIITLTYEACVPILTPVGWRSNLSFGKRA